MVTFISDRGIAPRAGVEPIAAIHVMEDHDAAYAVWKAAGLKNRTLVHFDGHMDFNWPSDRPDPGGAPPLRTVHQGNFIYEAIREGIVGDFCWVVPDPFWKSPERLRSLEKEVAETLAQRPQESGPMRWAGGAIRTSLMGCPLTICPLESLPDFQEPVLLDIDVDYLLTWRVDGDGLAPYFDPHHPGPWLAPSSFMKRLSGKRLAVDRLTLAHSVNGGYTPLKFKYFGDQIERGLRNPGERLMDGPLPGTAAEAYRRFLEALDSKRPAAARAAWKEMILKDPSYRTLYATGGYREEMSGRWEEALASYERLAQVDPGWAIAPLAQGRALCHLGRWSQARDALQRARSLNSNAPYLDDWWILATRRITKMTAPQNLLDTLFQRNPALVTRKVAGEIILVPVSRRLEKDAMLFTLDEVAAFLWERLDGRRTGRDLARALSENFEVAGERAEADVNRFLADLLEIEALQAQETSFSSTPS